MDGRGNRLINNFIQYRDLLATPRGHGTPLFDWVTPTFYTAKVVIQNRWSRSTGCIVSKNNIIFNKFNKNKIKYNLDALNFKCIFILSDILYIVIFIYKLNIIILYIFIY